MHQRIVLSKLPFEFWKLYDVGLYLHQTETFARLKSATGVSHRDLYVYAWTGAYADARPCRRL